MLRFRRYRVFLVGAVLMIIVLVRLSRTRQWENESTQRIQSAWEGYRKETHDHSEGFPSTKEEPKEPPVDMEVVSQSSAAEANTFVQEVVLPSKTSLAPNPISLTPAPILEDIQPDRKLATPSPISEEPISEEPISEKPNSEESVSEKPISEEPISEEPISEEPISEEQDHEIHQEGPGRLEHAQPAAIHWEKQVEHFPMSADSLIQLPSGKPVTLPKIQHTFSDETPQSRYKREERQNKVKEEFKKAWNGYKEHAWMHDQLSPVSGGYQDPFAGWAATLVDSLDTLCIMGLEEDFEEAVRAVGTIDFTTSQRSEIQVFEVTIRYLGGLLGAYDVSGGTKKVLLDKAVELAEILMGAFDTPNRMPVLFYNWKPTFASQAHRASTKSNLAELGSLSMEFTRLAQLTKQAKYYDAVARITNALEEWQNQGTTGLAGVFPTDVDASGCNRSAPVIKTSLPSDNPLPLKPLSADNDGYKAPTPKNVAEPKPVKSKGAKEMGEIELSITPGQPSRAHLEPVQKLPEKPKGGAAENKKRAESSTDFTGGDSTVDETSSDSPVKPASELSQRVTRTSTEAIEDWDCVSQGLDSTNSGYDTFSMGGSQDSTYEYFPKQFLLLGGLEDKYRVLYLNTMKAVREHMLYRPMVPNERDILFSGKIIKNGADGPTSFVPEVTHLTCFIGGMVGMGAKLFKLEDDLETAKKLADGCVWAYESMSSGIMPEGSDAIRCEDDSHCPWDETLWMRSLDPQADVRDQKIEDYESSKAARIAQEELERLAAESKVAAEESEKNSTPDPEQAELKIGGFDLPDNGGASGIDVDKNHVVPDTNSAAADPSIETKSVIQKRKLSEAEPGAVIDNPPQLPDTDIQDEQLQKKLKDTQIELLSAAPGREVKSPSKYVPKIPAPNEVLPDPSRPLTHKEFVEGKIKREGLAPGFVKISSNKYILRPEAIESVWYMYRITGDPIWQEKGWKMFESIIKATSTNYGHSAIRGVTGEFPPTQLDEMESFWLAETLKYFYLLYSTPDTISLDDWVLNTEAHPFKRPE